MKAKGVSPGRAVRRRSLASVKLLVGLAHEHGVSPEVCLMSSGIPVADLANPAAEIDMEQELTVIRNLQDLLGSEAGLGLAAGLRYHVTTSGILGYAAMSSATVREGITIMIRYLDLVYAYIPVRLEEDDHEIRIVFDDEFAPEDVRQFLIERLISGMYRMAREAFGGTRPMGRLEFRFPRPPYAEQFERIGAEKIVFAAARNMAVGDKSILDIPLPRRDEISQHLALAQCESLLNAQQMRVGLAGVIRQHLNRHLQHVPDMEAMATLLAMTTRTLRRRLDEEGATYRQLVDEVRVSRADDLLQTGMPVDRVAEHLGFSEAASFIRAYKRWTGTTPGRYEKN